MNKSLTVPVVEIAPVAACHDQDRIGIGSLARPPYHQKCPGSSLVGGNHFNRSIPRVLWSIILQVRPPYHQKCPGSSLVGGGHFKRRIPPSFVVYNLAS